MKKSASFILAIAAVAACIMATTNMADAGLTGFQWKTLPEALEQAPKENKKIVLDVYTDWCGWCKRMDKDTYADKEVAAYLAEHYVASKMNPEVEGKITYDGHDFTPAEFGQALQINGYPATAFFNEKMELLTVVPGYIPAKDFLVILKYFGDDHYKSMTFEEFKKKN